MSNGEMLEEMLRIMSGEMPVPERVTNRMLLAGMIELYKKQADLTDRMVKVELWQSLNAEKETKFVSWTWLLEKLAQPIAMVIIASVIGSIIARLIP